MSVARNCPYSDNEENCRYGIFTWVARLNKCSNCERFLKKRFPNIDTSSYNIDENGNVLREVEGRMTNLLKGHEDFIVSHTRKEIMQKFNVNYNYVNYFCTKNGLKPIAERCKYHVTDEMKDFLKEHTIKETAFRFQVGCSWLYMKIREMNLTYKRHNGKEVKLSTHSCKRTGEAQDMIRYLSKAFTMASIARVFGYTRENIRQICADNEE